MNKRLLIIILGASTYTSLLITSYLCFNSLIYTNQKVMLLVTLSLASLHGMLALYSFITRK